jgi:hypothetical protein
MKFTRKLLSVAGPLWLVTLNEAAVAQSAPKAPAAQPAAAAAAPKTAAAPAAAPAPAVESPAASTTVAPTTAPSAIVLDANAALPPPAPVAIPPAPPPPVERAPVPPPRAAAEPPAETLPKKIAIANSGWLQIGLLVQGWFAIEDARALVRPRVDDADKKTSTWDTTAYFRLRRAQLKIFGSIVPNAVDYLVILDGAKTLAASEVKTSLDGGAATTTTGYRNPGDTSALLEYMITYKSPYADLSIGEWKTAISYEGTTSSAELLLPERSYTSRYFGDYYDMGAKIEKKFEYVKYAIHMTQGVTGNSPTNANVNPSVVGPAVVGMPQPNQIDNNRQKDLTARLEFTPIKGIMVGGAGLMSVGQRANQQSTHDIVEADAQIDMEGFLARAEFIWGWQGKTGGGFTRTKSQGMVGSIGYTIAKRIQPVARIGYLNVDATTIQGDRTTQPLTVKFGSWYQTDEIRSYEFGVNYFIDGKYAKVQAAYAYLDFDDIPHRQQFILSGQASF